ncbi:transcriptional regulator, XRE family with cupin sensor [Desulfatibacillum alkenivorans DSM 16219]|uniref:Transcriptional regulator, XRE family with cupin sensor n=1 Tax=Desulfatibacillum alkenivorans DSM 16219 TaxID=1121393 RepID=A0A1M6FN75_9BACT|nr:XRE family transcriptional regulator [Desulfatibacillum alkenivorans]SHI99059.1 transcriptional regulator, XRE family with cupin sensor [Desulfatibacillum alkenivorans DSM 16219]
MPPKKKAKNISTGQRIHALRIDKDMDLETLANETGLAVDTLEKIESGENMPSVGSLLQIARALEVDSAFFLEKEAKTTKKGLAKAYSERTSHYAYTTLSPGARHKHMKAFKIEIPPRQEHDGVSYQHEGEEFVYVLSGKVEVTVGEHVNKLEEGGSLHFNSGLRHLLKNPGGDTALLLVVVYTP